MKSVWRVYIKPFDDYRQYADWIEVTDDVDSNSIGSIAVDLDNTEYDIGVYRNSSFKLTLRNDHGKYSDVGSSKSIFKYKRSNSLCKVTWSIDEQQPICGVAICGEVYLSEEVDVFVGLLNDDSLSMDLDVQKVSFSVLGRESIFLRTVVPFDTVNSGDLISETLLLILDQPEVTSVLTVSSGNISVGLDQTIDSLTGLQNKTIQEGLNKLLLAGNSVLYIDGDAIKVAPRTPTADVQATFYGQASPLGPENVVNIKAIKNGVGKVFNFITWRDTSLVSQDETSISIYGVRKKEIEFDVFTGIPDDTKRQSILDSIRDEFKNPKMEFDLYVPMTYETIALKLLDRINIDYPTIYYPSEAPLPICGVAVCGQAVLPKAKWDFKLTTLDHFKIIGRSIDLKASVIKLKVRGV
jgi:hypothetical protein